MEELRKQYAFLTIMMLNRNHRREDRREGSQILYSALSLGFQVPVGGYLQAVLL